MTTTYKPLATGIAPTLGTSGDAVKALQTQLNTVNVGQAGYTPLVVDGKYGPLTQAAASYKPAPTIAAAYNLPTVQEDPALTSARSDVDTYNKTVASGGSVVNEGKIRSDTLRQFQAEIDATNALYADKLNQAKLTGAGRVGSDTAIQARRGLLGSDFGATQTNSINEGNNQIYNSIGDEKATAVQAILGKAKQAAVDAIAARTKAIGEGLDGHLKYLSEAGERKKTNAQNAAAFIYSQKFSPDQLTPEELAKTAKDYGVTTDDIKNSFIEVKKTKDAEAAKAAADAAKEKNASLPASAQEYEYAKAQGYKGSYTQYQTEDANRKALSARASASTLDERNQAIVQQVNTLFAPGYIVPDSKGIPFIDQNGYATPEGFKTAALKAGLPRADFIKQFGYLVAPGLESKYGITGAELKLITGVAPEK